MEEAPIYQDILKRGKLDILFRLVKRRFGEVNSTIQTQIRDLSNNQIDDLSEELFDFSAISDLINWLNVQKQKSGEEVQPAIEN
ncbi:MAG TPA: DUF4351 domain-containing protein [Nostocaceae cyanobacterium]|nr:DUF4351 domain-containing protein [Nostocaceae cyanobacterium]